MANDGDGSNRLRCAMPPTASKIRPGAVPLAPRVGCAGWSLPSPMAARFPGEGTHLERYAQVFSAVEINSSFYRPHQPKTYARWADSVPASFRFSLKLPRTISHDARLSGADAALRQFCAGIAPLGDKLGCLLLQLPPSLALNAATARQFFAQLRRMTPARVVCEPRHASWFSERGANVLAEAGVSRVWADPSPLAGVAPPTTADLLYIRLHGSPRIYYSAYETLFLDTVREDYQKLYFTIMDFKGATRLFADPDFDGEPVVIYEPMPDEPVVPPDENSSTGAQEPSPPPYGPIGNNGYSPMSDGSSDERRFKYVIDDVDVRVAVERSQYLDADGKLITEDYRVLLRGDIKKALQEEFGSLADFLRRWNEAERKQAVLDTLAEHGIPLDILQQAVPNGGELDAFDLVAHVAFDQKPLTRRERVNNVKKRDVFGRYGDQARAVLEALLDKFADLGVQDIEDARVLELPPFDQFGSKTQIRRGIFGGIDQYGEAVKALECALYQAHEQKSA